jgi:hypothetical protein
VAGISHDVDIRFAPSARRRAYGPVHARAFDLVPDMAAERRTRGSLDRRDRQAFDVAPE